MQGTEKEAEPQKVQGDAVGEAAAETNGKAADAEEVANGDATAAGIEAGKTKEAEEPTADKEGEKVVEAGIAEAKPVTEAE